MARNDDQDKLFNLQAQQLAAQIANWAAQLDFMKERFRLLELPEFWGRSQLEIDKFAFEKAMRQWDQTYQEALLTGMYQGKPTIQWLTDQARLTGTYNGERTLEGLLTDAQIKDMQDKMKLANDQFIAATTGYFNNQKTFDREKFEAAQGLEGWKFLATLAGPQNAFRQARAIASMPGGLDQMMAAFAGRYMIPASSRVGPGGGSGDDYLQQLMDLLSGYRGNRPSTTPPPPTTPIAPAPPVPPPTDPALTPVTPQNQPVNLAPPPETPPGETPLPTAVGYSYQPPGVQAPPAAYNYSADPNGTVGVYPPGVASPMQTADISSVQPLNPASVQAVLQPAYQYGPNSGVTVPGGAENVLPAPNQINAENYGNSYQYQKDLLWATYEDAGYDKSLAQEAFLRSLPKYAAPKKGAFSF